MMGQQLRSILGIVAGLVAVYAIWTTYGVGSLAIPFLAVCAYCWGRGGRGRFIAPLSAFGSAIAGYLGTVHYGHGTGWIMAGFMIAACLIISLLATTFRRSSVTLSI